MRARVSSTSVLVLTWVVASAALGSRGQAQAPPGEAPNLGARLTQEEITGGGLSLLEIRRHGRRIFSTPFNKLDGYGDGDMNPDDPVLPGGRPTLQNNGTFLRVNGLDGQTCLECHSVLSAAVIPARLGVGGVGGSVTNVLFRPTMIDVVDTAGVGFASFNGRFINPPFLFGSGAVELLGKEMTERLQELKLYARDHPGIDVPLAAKGVDFGTIRYESGEWNTTGVRGVDEDLVVRPFGRKGSFPSVRAFDVDAMQFHFGMQPVEAVGEDVDSDGDGVGNEILVGEISALHIFATTAERPTLLKDAPGAREGLGIFRSIGCAECHRPVLRTDRETLAYSFPEVPTDPFANAFYEVDLSQPPARFKKRPSCPGLIVPLFADLKRHDMGPGLAESHGAALDTQFTTARLWGVADTAPYLHDGRATTLTEAILLHGGEAQAARDAFAGLADESRIRVLDLLRALRTPQSVGADLDEPPAAASGAR